MKGLTKKAKKLQVKKDRVMTAFSIWLKQNERINQLKQSGADTLETAKAASAEWQEMTDAEKAMWRKQQPFRVQTTTDLYCADFEKSPYLTEVHAKVSIKAVNFFSFLPDKIIVDHVFRLLLPAHYATLHLVSRRFRRLLISYAHQLPRVKLDELTFEVDDRTSNLIASTYNVKRIKKPVPCRNMEAWTNISPQDMLLPGFNSMTGHIEFSGLLKFDDDFFTMSVLLQLTLMALRKQLKPDAVEFNCSMEQITEGQLALFLRAVSPTMTSLSIGRTYDRRDSGLITDALLKPIVSSGTLQVLELLKQVAVTDETLDNFQFPERFVLDFTRQKVTVQGVLRFIRRFQACETAMKPKEQQLIYLNVNLEKRLRKLISPSKRQKRNEKDVTWIVKKNSTDDSPILVIDFDEVHIGYDD